MFTLFSFQRTHLGTVVCSSNPAISSSFGFEHVLLEGKNETISPSCLGYNPTLLFSSSMHCQVFKIGMLPIWFCIGERDERNINTLVVLPVCYDAVVAMEWSCGLLDMAQKA